MQEREEWVIEKEGGEETEEEIENDRKEGREVERNKKRKGEWGETVIEDEAVNRVGYD